MRKIISFILCLCLVCSMLGGCTINKSEDKTAIIEEQISQEPVESTVSTQQSSSDTPKAAIEPNGVKYTIPSPDISLYKKTSIKYQVVKAYLESTDCAIRLYGAIRAPSDNLLECFEIQYCDSSVLDNIKAQKEDLSFLCENELRLAESAIEICIDNIETSKDMLDYMREYIGAIDKAFDAQSNELAKLATVSISDSSNMQNYYDMAAIQKDIIANIDKLKEIR